MQGVLDIRVRSASKGQQVAISDALPRPPMPTTATRPVGGI